MAIDAQNPTIPDMRQDIDELQSIVANWPRTGPQPGLAISRLASRLVAAADKLFGPRPTEPYAPQGDAIAYLVVTKGGGMDGMDPNDKGGRIKFASFDKAASDEKVDAWSVVEPRVVDLNASRRRALAKLDGLDRLMLGLPPG